MVVTMMESGEWRQSGAWGGLRGQVGGNGGLIRWPAPIKGLSWCLKQIRIVRRHRAQ